MTTLSFRRSAAALAAASLAAFGPGLSGYDAAAQIVRSAPAVNMSLPLPAVAPEGLGSAPSMDAALPAGGLSEPLSLGSLETVAPAAPSALAPTLSRFAAEGTRGTGGRVALRRQGLQAARLLKPSAGRIGSMGEGSAYQLGSQLEAVLTRTAASQRADDVNVEESASLGSLNGQLSSRGLSASPEDRDRFSFRSAQTAAPLTKEDAASFTRRVYDWMAIGLGVTAFFAYAVGTNAAVTAAIFSSPALLIGLVVAELGLVIGLGIALPKLSFQAAAGGFLLYSALNGVLLSSVLQVYAAASVIAAFGVTAGMFAGIAAFGHLTKKNLDGVGTYAGMALWGLILASVANMFMHSSGLSALLTYASVLVFTGLTAYNAQKIRQLAESGVGSQGPGKNLAIWGALTLYLDFVNLFLNILKIIGKAKEKK
jgi:FtsH-binding integral membrane protein